MKVTTIGIDLAKNVFQVHGVDERGKVGMKKQLKRDQVLAFFANFPGCLIGMEACASAHYWARKLQGLGHTVKLMAPQFVKPYVKSNKNDVADAEAICEAVGRPNMRFVPIKTAEQQAILAVHRARQGLVKARTAQANQIRGLLGEFGLVIPQGISHIAKRLPEIRQVSAWLGMVPRQASSGGKATLLGMSKRGDSYLRTLLIHGARSVLQQVQRHPGRADPWLKQLLARRPKNVVAVALANKNARIAWALLAHRRDYQVPARSA